MIQIKSVLISDEIDQECVDILENNGVVVTVKTNMAKDVLLKEVEKHDALIVRSATRVTKEVIEAGKQLKLIGRAGTGVDNIDLPVANEHGVIVMNTPAGNSRSACELTCTMVMSLARHVPQAHASMKAGKWARKDFMGQEVFGKTLAIIGLGRIGREVATRMQAFGMKTIGFDPLVSVEEAATCGIEWLPLDKIWPLADYITLHVPLIPATENLINKTTLQQCKRGVYVINVARGGIIEETDLLAALNDSHCAGAAFDVYIEEPPKDRSLIDHPKVICTPHLGASTNEAQQRVAREIAENIVALNAGVGLYGALNGAAVAAALDESKAQWVRAAQSLAQVVAALFKTTGQKPTGVTVQLPKAACGLDKALKAAVVVGLLKSHTHNGLNLINAELNAKNAGIVVEAKMCDGSVLTVRAGEVEASGYPTPAGCVLTAFNRSKLPLPLLVTGTLALSDISNSVIPADMTPRPLLEIGASGGGRIAVFDKSIDQQTMALLSSWTIVNAH
uniref:D-3-phosphoglycerate dehydrogenase n=1 Tax=Plectus sambesii TaxID=2011161 RepID=A0A914WNM1_9BILA